MNHLIRPLVVVLLLVAFLLPTSPVLAQVDSPDSPSTEEGGSTAPAPVYMPIVAAHPGMTLEEATFTLDEFGLAADPPKSGAGESAPEDADAVAPPEPAKSAADAAAEAAARLEIDAIDAWQTIVFEGFEGEWPAPGWSAWDANGATGGELYWGDTSYRPFTGSWSAWPADSGPNKLDAHTRNYAHNMRTFLRYGPFSLAGATAATFSFNLWNQSELNYDFVGWWVSTDGQTWHGQRLSGDTGGWQTRTMDLANVPGLVNVLGLSRVWIAFTFTSDASVALKGPFIDNVTLRADVSQCLNAMHASYYSGTSFNTQKGTACEDYFIHHDWGTGGPGFGIGGDNFSARYVGSVPFVGGAYTFTLTSDDGSRLWVDNTLLIDQWRLQEVTSRTAKINLSPGRHVIRVDYFEADGGAYLDLTWTR